MGENKSFRYIRKTKKNYPFLNYIDDLIYIGLPSEIHQAYAFLLSLLQDLGLQMSQSKLVPNCTAVICLGILVDTVTKTILFHQKNCRKFKKYVQKGPSSQNPVNIAAVFLGVVIEY